MATTDPNIIEVLDGLAKFYQDDAAKMTGGRHRYLSFPDGLEADDIQYSSNVENQYIEVLSKLNEDQEPIEMITRGNNYYYLKAICKTHRLYRRDRITEGCLGLSFSTGVKRGLDTKKSIIDNLKQVGNVFGPSIGGKT